MQSFLRPGITTVVDAQVTRRELQTYLAAKEAERLPIRVNMLVISALLDELLRLGLVGRLGDDELAILGIKLYADGSFGACTAYFPEGYASDPHNHGVLYHEPSEFLDLILSRVPLPFSRRHRRTKRLLQVFPCLVSVGG